MALSKLMGTEMPDLNEFLSEKKVSRSTEEIESDFESIIKKAREQ